MSSLWNANTDTQYILNAYATSSYCSSYMTKLDRSMTSAFKKIRTEHEKEKNQCYRNDTYTWEYTT